MYCCRDICSGTKNVQEKNNGIETFQQIMKVHEKFDTCKNYPEPQVVENDVVLV